MSSIVAIANQKGGVGKTTSSVNLAASLSQMKRKVLLVDIDPQGNATMGSGIDKHDLKLSIYDVILGDVDASEAIVEAEAAGYDLLGANADLTGAELDLPEIEQREFRLRKALAAVRNDYDYLIIDCPPALGLLTLNGLVAADSIIIPMQCEYYALEGLSALMESVERIRASFNPSLIVEGLIRTMYDPRNSLSREVSLQLVDHFGDRVYRTLVPRNVRLAEAPSYGVPVIFYDKYSRGARAYLAFAGEVVKRFEA